MTTLEDVLGWILINIKDYMPTMIRSKGKGKQIAFSILGIPENMLYKRTPKQKKRDDALYITQNNTSSRIF